MHCFRITITKDVGGECVQMPILTLESIEAAEDRFEDAVLDEFNELNEPWMRNVGGRAELYLMESDNILLDGDVIRHVTVKRPLHSPSASVFRHGDR